MFAVLSVHIPLLFDTSCYISLQLILKPINKTPMPLMPLLLLLRLLLPLLLPLRRLLSTTNTCNGSTICTEVVSGSSSSTTAITTPVLILTHKNLGFYFYSPSSYYITIIISIVVVIVIIITGLLCDPSGFRKTGMLFPFGKASLSLCLGRCQRCCGKQLH